MGLSCRGGVGHAGGGVGDEEIGWVMKGWVGLCKIS